MLDNIEFRLFAFLSCPYILSSCLVKLCGGEQQLMLIDAITLTKFCIFVTYTKMAAVSSKLSILRIQRMYIWLANKRAYLTDQIERAPQDKRFAL